ncbi:hypothetical protein Dimus_002952, partial [Dionaea muscipula]
GDVQDFSLSDGVNPLANNSDLEDEGAEDAENLKESLQEEGHEHAEEENSENSVLPLENDITVQ